MPWLNVQWCLQSIAKLVWFRRLTTVGRAYGVYIYIIYIYAVSTIRHHSSFLLGMVWIGAWVGVRGPIDLYDQDRFLEKPRAEAWWHRQNSPKAAGPSSRWCPGASRGFGPRPTGMLSTASPSGRTTWTTGRTASHLLAKLQRWLSSANVYKTLWSVEIGKEFMSSFAASIFRVKFQGSLLNAPFLLLKHCNFWAIFVGIRAYIKSRFSV